jgi:hypothetical protein
MRPPKGKIVSVPDGDITLYLSERQRSLIEEQPKFVRPSGILTELLPPGESSPRHNVPVGDEEISAAGLPNEAGGVSQRCTVEKLLNGHSCERIEVNRWWHRLFRCVAGHPWQAANFTSPAR